jgi:Flp pilus assembly pilin Flp
MQILTNKLWLVLQNLISREDGQDLAEYALVVALIAFGSIASMQFLSGAIEGAFGLVGQTLTSNIT